MRLAYFANTDSLYIELADGTSVERREASPGIVLDYGANGTVVGIDIDNASRKVDLDRVVLRWLASSAIEHRSNNPRPRSGRSPG